jgi:aspartyl-tRNA(Asn)/glutamyl-tRNA(Gln) amidotransferase subunit B
MPETYETIIGLEIHVQMKTKSKMFCSCDNSGETKPANTTICEICTGQPGTLPIPNEQAIQWAIRAALALGCTVELTSKFDRKHYFYPDLPKGYQISQYDQPIGHDGFLEVSVEGRPRKIGIERLHVEEDSAKLLHEPGKEGARVDFNRSGTPLIEIVTRPDIKSPAEARIFLKELKLIMQYLGVSDAEMEKGHLRVDANVSLRQSGDRKLYPKTEVKNLNSFRSVERALAFEVERQQKLWESGKPPDELATRGWEEAKQATIEQRTKEESADYRYFPEPDIPPLNFTQEYIEQIRMKTPELPSQRRQRFQAELGFTTDDATLLVADKQLAGYTEEVMSELQAWILAEKPKDRGVTWNTHRVEFAKLAANWMINRYLKLINIAGASAGRKQITAENFAELLTLLWENQISAATGQAVLEEMFETGRDPSDIIEAKHLGQVTDEATLGAVIDRILVEHPKESEAYRQGKTTLIRFFVGQIMKATGGQADPETVNRLLVHKLK